MNLEEQRAILATGIMGYTEVDRNYIDCEGEPLCLVSEYTPDLQDICSLDQANNLKARLRELGCEYTSRHVPDTPIRYSEYPFRFTISLWVSVNDKYTEVGGYSELSEGAALLQAASKLAKEMK